MEYKLKEVMETITKYKDEADYTKHENETLSDLAESLETNIVYDLTPRTYNGASDTSHFHELTPETIYNAIQRDMKETDFHNDIVEYGEELQELSEHELVMYYIASYYRVFTLNGHLYITNN